MKYRVKLTKLIWDDGKGEYDVSDLPTKYTAIVVGDTARAAIEAAMDEAGENTGCLIQECEAVAIRWS